MIASEIMLSLRYNLDDLTQKKYSDIEIIEAINSVIRYINLGLVNSNSTITMEQYLLEPDDGIAYLPDDFISLVSVDDEDIYILPSSFIGNKIFIDSPIKIIYQKNIIPIANKEDEIELPNYFYEMIVRFAEAFITKTIAKDIFAQTIYKEVASVTSGREITHIERELPFTI